MDSCADCATALVAGCAVQNVYIFHGALLSTGSMLHDILKVAHNLLSRNKEKQQVALSAGWRSVPAPSPISDLNPGLVQTGAAGLG